MFVTIQSWDYLIQKEGSSGFSIWHHVTPADGGYGTEVRKLFPMDYMERCSVGSLYDQICGLHVSPSPQYYDRERELERLEYALRSIGAL